MDWWIYLVLILGTLMVLFATGLPVAFCFLLLGGAGSFAFFGGLDKGFQLFTINIFTSIASFTYLAIPCFLLMGYMLFYSGLAGVAVNVLDKSLGRIPGRLSVLSIVAGTIFAFLSGSASCSAALLVNVLFPEMDRRKYAHEMSLGALMAGGLLAAIIPPSSMAVILGGIANIPIGELLIAIVIPGLLMSSAFIAYIVFRCWRNPSLAPSYQLEAPLPFIQIAWLNIKYVLPLSLLFVAAIGLVFFGITTATEAAASGALTAFLLATAYRKLDFAVIKRCLTDTAKVSIMVLMIVAGSATFGQLMATSGASAGLVKAVIGLSLSPLAAMIGMQLILVLMGMFLESAAIVVITMPLFMPIVLALHIDVLWFGAISLVNLIVGGLTPPFGLILMVVCGMVPKNVTTEDVYRSGIPYIFVAFFVMMLYFVFPSICTWLPTVMK